MIIDVSYIKNSYKSGIYKISNIINNKVYIGSAVLFKNRKGVHLHDLINNKHHNKYLQNSWNKYGDDNFKFEIIEIVDNKETLIEREQFWMDYYKSYEDKYGYNLCKIAGSSLGNKLSKETKIKISESKKNNHIGENNPNTKLTEEIVIKIKNMIKSGMKLIDITKEFNIGYSIVSHIKNNRSWTHIKID